MREAIHDPVKMWVSQKILLRNGGELLLLTDRFSGLQDCAGGRLNDDIRNNLTQAGVRAELIREVEEELGEAVTYSTPKMVGTSMHVNQKGDLVFIVFYEAQYQGGDIVLSDEHTSFKWVDCATYDPTSDHWYPSHLEFISKYLRGELNTATNQQ